MLTFLAANLGYVESPLAPAMAAMLKIRKPTTALGLENALGWQINTGRGKEIIWKDGGTFGYSSFVGYDRETKTGVVVLSNTFTMAGVSDIGLHLLVPAFPIIKAEPPKEHKEIGVDPKLLDSYVGRYQLAPNFILTVTREGSHLGAQATNQGKFEIFPENDRTFFARRIADIQITFETGALVLRQSGIDTRAARIP
jgi:CubicO group peptidase (beta-lactamase class C family)